MQDVTLAHYAGYDEEEIDPVFKLMVDYLARPVSHEAFFKKYASKKFLKGICQVLLRRASADSMTASILTRQWAKKNAETFGIDISLPLDHAAR